jgi:hypothetical protein
VFHGQLIFPGMMRGCFRSDATWTRWNAPLSLPCVDEKKENYMNIFVLDHDIRKCARCHADQHVVKMILEGTGKRMTEGDLYERLV